MADGILVLLDALGTSGISGQDLKEKVKDFDLVDERVSKDISILSHDLEQHHFSNLIFSGTIYDNFQIFLPIDVNNSSFVDVTGKNDWYWSLISIGNLLIDVFRYALFHNIPIRGCITSGYGEVSRTKRILGPVADEAACFYEITDWIGIVVTNHPAIVLNNKLSINPKKEPFEPYIKYNVPVKELIFDNTINAWKPIYRNDDSWSLRWPIQQGFEKKVTDDFIVGIPSNRTQYGDIISDDIIVERINEGTNHQNADTSKKWKNTLDFFNYVKKARFYYWICIIITFTDNDVIALDDSVTDGILEGIRTPV